MTATVDQVPAAAVALRRQLVLEPHQRPIYDFLTTRTHAGAWLEIGSGKTLTVLAALQQMRPLGHILVVAPMAIARSTWLDEIEQWGFPIQTKSLITDDNDRELDKAQRLARFREVFTDPPTMYFINQDKLTLPPVETHLLRVVPAGSAIQSSAVSAGATEVLQHLIAAGAMTRAELVTQVTGTKVAGRTLSKTRAGALITELTKAGHVVTERVPCRSCHGKGCTDCRFGLIDQMPIQRIGGKDHLVWPFPTVIIDEAQAFRSHDSQRFKALASVRPMISRMIQMTGTPAPNGLHGLWSQIYLLDQGEALGKNITAFRDRWFVRRLHPTTGATLGWDPVPGADEQIHQAISHLVISGRNASSTMPPLTISDQHVVLPPDIAEEYRAFRKNLVMEVIDSGSLVVAETYFDAWLASPPAAERDEAERVRDRLASLPAEEAEREHGSMVLRFAAKNRRLVSYTVVAENSAVLKSKLIQFASGTIYTHDTDRPDTDGRYEVIHDKKLVMLEHLIRSNPGSPVLIAYYFRSDRQEILSHLTKAGVHVEAFDKSRDMVRRWNEGSIQAMLIHPASAGHGLNLQHGGNLMVWYTLTSNLEHYMQANGRLFRKGQTKPVTIYRLLTRGTEDMGTPAALERKSDTQAELMRAVASTKGAAQPADVMASMLRSMLDPALAADIDEIVDA